MFYNTIYYRSEELKKAWDDAQKQEDIILFIFRTNSTKSFTPSEMWDFFTKQGCKWPLTSVRRAITDLTSKKELIKLDKMKDGIYGKKEGMWQYKQLPKMMPGSLF